MFSDVLGPGGHPIVVKRDDGSGFARVDIAITPDDHWTLHLFRISALDFGVELSHQAPGEAVTVVKR